MRGIDQPGLGPGRDGPLCLLCGDLGAFERNPGDDRNLAVNRLDEASMTAFARLRQKRAFTRMTENNQAFDAFEAAEPGAETLDRSVIDFTVAGKRGYGAGTRPRRSRASMCISSDGIDVGRIVSRSLTRADRVSEDHTETPPYA